MTTSPTAVAVTDLTAGYGPSLALCGIDLQIEHGELVALVGPNGGGKSTLIKLITGLLSPVRGTVRIYGQPPRRARHRIGYLPQTEALDLTFPLSVRDLVAMGRLRPSWRPQPLRSADRTAVTRALERTGIVDLAERGIAAVSAGQRQRALLARALATEPDMLVLDEPEAGLDPDSTAQLYRLLSSLAGRLTIVLASHDVDAISGWASRVLVVERGLTTRRSTPADAEPSAGVEYAVRDGLGSRV